VWNRTYREVLLSSGVVGDEAEGALTAMLEQINIKQREAQQLLTVITAICDAS
jgi:hypothetical protein